MKFKANYPTDSNGLAIPLEELGIPTAEGREYTPEVQMHHMYWSEYAHTQNLVRTIFAQLDYNIKPVEVGVHHGMIHDKYIGVRVVGMAVMMEAIETHHASGGLVYPLPRKTKNPVPLNHSQLKAVKKEYTRLHRYEY